MKKSISKKLMITKETVSNLNYTEMNYVKGGYATASCPAWGCDSAEVNCTTGCMGTDYCDTYTM